MKQILALSLIGVLFMVSCQGGKNRDSNGSSGEKVLVDTLAYAVLVEGFEKRFAAIETEYDSASAERQLELEAEFEEVDLEMAEAQKQFVREYPASNQSLSVLVEIDWSFESASEYREYLELLHPSLYENSQYGEMDNLVKRMEQVEVGNQAPDFEMTDVQGTVRKLSEIYEGSEYLLLDFWASSCGPCRKENGNIVSAHERFHSQGFDVLGVSTDTRKEHWVSAIEADKLTWTNLCSLEPWNENEVVSLYALRQVSQNFLLDSSGNIIATDLRGEELITTLENLLK